MNEALIKEVFSNQDFVQSLLGMETPEEVQAALKEKHLELSVDEILALQKALAAQENGELSEDDLENVAGGFVISGTLIAIGSVCGAIASAAGLTHTVTNRRW